MTHTDFAPATGAALWRGADLADDRTAFHALPPEALADIDRALARVSAARLALSDVTPAKFPLPSLDGVFAVLRRALRDGRGFAVLTGLPVDRYDRAALGAVFCGIGSHLGVGVSQSHRGDYLGDVIDWNEDGNERPYRRGGELTMHRDPIDIVGLCCRRKAKRGGESRIASALALHNIVLAERPDLLQILYEGFYLYRPAPDRGEAPPLTPRRVPVFKREPDGRLECFYIPDVIEGAVKRAGLALAPREDEALAFIAEAARRPGVYLDMDLKPGDMQFLNNRVIVHARLDYDDYPEFDRKRHMLRLWLMAPEWGAPDPAMRLFDDSDRAGGGVPARRAEARV
ncbi:MAG TPA: TauD/TfdA family dioxygenase [Alphaproteobacteria bacterium]|jgi:hypothetical protein|nr:TauD/TfdA family dioxygenase [Alphaproteobacteria bacterium]